MIGDGPAKPPVEQVSQEQLLLSILTKIDEVKTLAVEARELGQTAAQHAADAAKSAETAANSVLDFGRRLEQAEVIARRAADDASSAKRMASDTDTKVSTDLGAAAVHLAKIGEAASAVTAAGEAISAPIAKIQEQNDGQTKIMQQLSNRIRMVGYALIVAAPTLGAAAAAAYSAFMNALGHHAP